MIKNLNLRFNLDKPDDLKAWNCLMERHNTERLSYSQLIIRSLMCEINDESDALADKIARKVISEISKDTLVIREDNSNIQESEEDYPEVEADWDFLGV